LIGAPKISLIDFQEFLSFLSLFSQEDWEYVLPSQARIGDAGRMPRDLIVPVVADYAATQRQLHETLIMNIQVYNSFLFL
jgi:hypothetical protein